MINSDSSHINNVTKNKKNNIIKSSSFIIPTYDDVKRTNMDKTIKQIIIDAKELPENEFVMLLNKPLFDSNKPIERLKIPDSVVLRIAYTKHDRF